MAYAWCRWWALIGWCLLAGVGWQKSAVVRGTINATHTPADLGAHMNPTCPRDSSRLVCAQLDADGRSYRAMPIGMFTGQPALAVNNGFKDFVGSSDKMSR